MLAKQLPILSDVDTHDIEGVISAIIYLPSSRVHVGQTIRSSFHSFKKHFSDANNHDSKNCHLHKLMLRDRNLYNYFLWPLEYIDPTFYEHSDNSTSRKRFRSYANQRELFWIRKLKSLSPRGLNAVLPYRNNKSRRPPRPNRNQQNKLNNFTTCTFISQNDNHITIDTSLGPYLYIQKILLRFYRTLSSIG